MPNYEYKCKTCGEHLSKYQNMSDEPLITCSICGGGLVRLLSGGGGVIFKGEGFYVNDYKKKESVKASSGSK
ncbi:MAG: FmdB family zinc ribbon protein [Candidatus Marinimicrobia bacterium]|nr:FmdB family zinc ribbon protein [Candidatus Neomarinimicrobiota bacterium]